MTRKKIVLRHYVTAPGAAYIELHAHPHTLQPGIVARSVDVHSLIRDYDGPRICIDFDENGTALGIEIVYPSEE